MLATKVEEAKREEGFTLIELLVVVIIIGILAAIAIPVFLNQREKAWNSAAQSDLRNAAVALESYFTENGSYGEDALTSTDYGFAQSADVVLDDDGVGTDTYCVTARHKNHDEDWEIRPGQAVTAGDCS